MKTTKQKPIQILFLALFVAIFIACNKNSAPVIEAFITESDSVKTGSSVNFEVIISDADNDPTQCYWFFDGKLKTEYSRKPKITWVAPNTPDNVIIKVVVDDGTEETSLTKTIFIY